MKSFRVAAVFCGALLIISVALGQGSTPRKITVVAHKYAFEPSHLELKVGEPVEITFESQDKEHGFSCKDLTPEKVVFEKDKPATITITPQKAGTYRFKCAHWCGFGHGKMKGEIVVAP